MTATPAVTTITQCHLASSIPTLKQGQVQAWKKLAVGCTVTPACAYMPNATAQTLLNLLKQLLTLTRSRERL
jgi:hypothetical protein